MGLVHIYCGDGKGKTTAAVGLAVRACGAGKKILFVQFLKSESSSERRILKQLDGIELTPCPEKVKFTFRMDEAEKQECRERCTSLLRLTEEEDRLAALRAIVAKKMNVAQTEAYIETLLRRRAAPPRGRRPSFIIKDVRLFLNAVDHNMEIMRRAGVDAQCGREETEDAITLTIRIPKARPQASP